MKTEFISLGNLEQVQVRVWVVKDKNSIPHKDLENYGEYISRQLETNKEAFIYRYPGLDALFLLPEVTDENDKLEQLRRFGHKTFKKIKEIEAKNVFLWIVDHNLQWYEAYIEGLMLSSYSFDKYKTKKETYALEKIFLLEEIQAGWAKIGRTLDVLRDAVFFARDLVNEPANVLNALTLPERIREKLSHLSNVEITVWGRAEIEKAGMGGILGVNQGSFIDPSFTILHYDGTKGKMQPVVLVGKGITFDTGGINLKPTQSLETMKCDMSGAAAVAATFFAVATMELPIHLYALIPATDNRPGNKALVPGDVIRMYNGKTVEVNNTDAEGRLILADALAYAGQFNPLLNITIATLTGAAHIAVGDHAIAGMEKNANSFFQKMVNISYRVYERIVPLPLWDEFGESLKSEVADISNSGSRYGGAMVGGKFLEYFASGPFIHLDIAGPAFLEKEHFYQPTGGTGVGVRLLYRYLEEFSEKA